MSKAAKIPSKTLWPSSQVVPGFDPQDVNLNAWEGSNDVPFVAFDGNQWVSTDPFYSKSN